MNVLFFPPYGFNELKRKVLVRIVQRNLNEQKTQFSFLSTKIFLVNDKMILFIHKNETVIGKIVND